MAGLHNARVIVAGAGALGASVAFALAQAGARVILTDPAALAANASGVAAGMLAPAFEAVLDATSSDRFPLLHAARQLWPPFADRIGDIGLRRSGAVWVDLPGAEPAIPGHAQRLEALGADAVLLSAEALLRRVPGLSRHAGPGLFTPEDWRLEPRTALGALRRGVLAAGGQIAAGSVSAFEPGLARFADGRVETADALVLATGPDLSDLAPELAAMAPIKGQILRYAETRADDDRPIVRCRGGYAVPARDGLRIGATMEPGRSDRRIDAAAAAPLGRLSAELFPDLEGATFLAQAGVRAATPDGLPLVGPSERPGVYLATGARRNGWLLAPLVARMIAAYLAGRDPGPFEAVLAARRFAPA